MGVWITALLVQLILSTSVQPIAATHVPDPGWHFGAITAPPGAYTWAWAQSPEYRAAHPELADSTAHFGGGQPSGDYAWEWAETLNRLITSAPPIGTRARFDAHDGAIRLFNGTYWWYGTSYLCGFRWQEPSPFCGFRSLSSTDLANWTDHGLLFPLDSNWSSRCAGLSAGGGCFRPKVVYSPSSNKYVLWFNQATPSGPGRNYAVMTADNPAGPFSEVATTDCCMGNGVGEGDEDVWTDNDGSGYLAATVVKSATLIQIKVVRLDASGTQVVGPDVFIDIPGGQMESPALFKRSSTYYLVVSDPTCGYCSGTGSGYLTAPAALGPWTYQGKFSENSCNGQPAAISPTIAGDYLYQSDLWQANPDGSPNHNQKDADQWWGRLSFDASGAIQPLNCSKPF